MKKLTKFLIVPVVFGAMGLSTCHKNFDAKSYAPPLVINGYTNSAAVAKSNLAAYYAFNGSLIDSVSGQQATSFGTSFGNGEIGKGLQGGLNAYVSAAPSQKIKSLQSFTISEWVNTPPPSTGIIGIFSLANTTAFWGNIDVFFENGSSNTNGIFKMHIANATSDGFFVVSNLQNLFGKWVNLTFTYNQTDGSSTLYVNGSKAGSGASGITGPLNFANLGPLTFGCVQFMTTPSETSATSSQPWASFNTGLTDEVRIYDRVLTDVEVSSIVALQGRGK